jgi:hypothetical protein
MVNDVNDRLTQDLPVRSIGTNAVDHRKGKFALGKILRKAFVHGVLCTARQREGSFVSTRIKPGSKL